MFSQVVDLFFNLDSLGRHGQVQAVSQGDNCAYDRCIFGVIREVYQERLVDLQLFNREALQVTQGGISGTEIIDGQGTTQVTDRVKNGKRPFYISHHDTLSNLDHQFFRCQLTFLECRID